MLNSPYYTDKAIYASESLMCDITSIPGLDFIPRLLVEMAVALLSTIPCIVITAVTYLRTVISVKKLARVHFHRINSGIHKLLWYPAVLFLVLLPSLVDHFVHVIDPTHVPSLTFLVPHVAITHSIGFINAIIYGLQKRTPEYKRSKTIESLDGGSKRVDLTKLPTINGSDYQENTMSLHNSGLV